MMRLNRVRLLIQAKHAGDSYRIPRGMTGFRRWVRRHGLMETDANGWRDRITSKGMEALRVAISEYERHHWMGRGGASYDAQRAVR